MSINQAAIHYNLPYSSLYGRFKRGKFENDPLGHPDDATSDVHNTSTHSVTVVTTTQTITSQPMQQASQQSTHHQQLQQQQQQQLDVQQSSSQPTETVVQIPNSPSMQSQLMLLQYQHTPPPPVPTSHMPMYQSSTTS